MKNQGDQRFDWRLLAVGADNARSCANSQPEVAKSSKQSSSTSGGSYCRSGRRKASRLITGANGRIPASEKTTAPLGWRVQPFVLLLATLFSLVRPTEPLKFSSVRIPSLVQRNANFWLVCKFELEQHGESAARPAQSGDQLYSVKWYKNNEEFYRLMLAASSSENAAPPSGSGQQQQYFAQAGVNVMMSASNATHVRLLNASLESEGVYACEISTQNLSTIRYEREVRVYVLPHSKLNIIGLRTRYSLGDQVDLTCASDFSKPEPALAWFINGRRIRADSQSRRLGLQLDSRPAKSKLNEPTLFRLSLGLKFKLTDELLWSLAGHASSSSSTTPTSSLVETTPTSVASVHHARRQSNQSQGRRRQPPTRPSGAPAIGRQRRQLAQDGLAAESGPVGSLELRLQCKYRLTEVSDVTFNELVARQAYRPSQAASVVSSNFASDDASITAPGESNDDNDDGTTNDELATRDPKSQLAAASTSDSSMPGGLLRQAELRVTKSNGNQVNQGKCPAAGWELVRALSPGPGGGRGARPEPTSCQLGALALQPEDPLIVLAAGRATIATGKAASSSGRRRRSCQLETTGGGDREQPIESSPGTLISVNCSTIGALLGDAALTSALGSNNNNRLHRADNDDASGDSNYFAAADSGESFSSSSQNWQTKNGQHVGADNYCSDAGARKRAAISGKHWATTTNEEPALFLAQLAATASGSSSNASPNSNQRSATQSVAHRQLARPPNGRQVAYLSLSSPATTTTSTSTIAGPAGTSVGPSGNNLWPADSADSALSTQPRPTQLQATQGLHLSAPPLLEWFINNQEAPTWSVSYSPPLPLVAPAAGRRRSGSAATSAASSAQAIRSDAGDADALALGGGDDDVYIESEEPKLPGSQRQGASAQAPGSSQPPSVDYKEYFANFDARPSQQHLALNLTLTKRHFMTPDSKLRLRCSSTQAQVILADSASVLIVTVASANASPLSGQVQSQLATGNGHSSWQSKQANKLLNGNQIGARHQHNNQLVRLGSQARPASSGSGGLFEAPTIYHRILAATQAIAVVATASRIASH